MLEEQVAPPSGFAALANRKDRYIGRFCRAYSLPSAVFVFDVCQAAVCNSG